MFKMVKPSLKLTALEKTIIDTSTFEEYKEILRVFHCGGWMYSAWGDFHEYPHHEYSKFDYFKREFGNHTGIAANNIFNNKGWTLIFNLNSSVYKEELNYKKIITPQEFYKIQGINANQIKRINDFFDKNEGRKEIKRKEGNIESAKTGFIDPWKVKVPEYKKGNEELDNKLMLIGEKNYI
jgi:hypothetical protein